MATVDQCYREPSLALQGKSAIKCDRPQATGGWLDGNDVADARMSLTRIAPKY